MGAELFHEDGRTDIAELIVAFRNSSNAPKSPQNARNFCQVIYIMTLVRLHLLRRCKAVIARKMRESSVTGQKQSIFAQQLRIYPEGNLNFLWSLPLTDKIPARGRQYLLMQGSKQTFWRQEVRTNISSSRP